MLLTDSSWQGYHQGAELAAGDMQARCASHAEQWRLTRCGFDPQRETLEQRMVRNRVESAWVRRYWPLYEGTSDESLLEQVRQQAALLRRPPYKSEIFPVYRAFLLTRFGQWTRVLAAAGLKPRSGHRPPFR